MSNLYPVDPGNCVSVSSELFFSYRSSSLSHTVHSLSYCLLSFWFVSGRVYNGENVCSRSSKSVNPVKKKREFRVIFSRDRNPHQRRNQSTGWVHLQNSFCQSFSTISRVLISTHHVLQILTLSRSNIHTGSTCSLFCQLSSHSILTLLRLESLCPSVSRRLTFWFSRILCLTFTSRSQHSIKRHTSYFGWK